MFLLHSITSCLEQLLNQVSAIRTLVLAPNSVYGGGISTLNTYLSFQSGGDRYAVGAQWLSFVRYQLISRNSKYLAEDVDSFAEVVCHTRSSFSIDPWDTLQPLDASA